MSTKPTVFLSYQHASSIDLARYLYDRLTVAGADVFFDVETLDYGRFATIIESEIITRDFFIVVLKPDTLKSEWVIKEIETALRHRKNIVPLLVSGFNFSSQPLPSSISELKEHNGVTFDIQFADASITRLKRVLGLKSGVPFGIWTAVLIIIVVGVVLVFLNSLSLPNSVTPKNTDAVVVSHTPTNAAIITPTPTSSPTQTVTPSPTPSRTITATNTVTSTATRTITSTPTLNLPALTQAVIPTVPSVSLTTTPFPQVQATVTNVTFYPCEATIIFRSSAVLNVVRANPSPNAPLRTPIQQGISILILAQVYDSRGSDWYQIADTHQITLGWIPAEYVIPSVACPK
jgi:hypothetical protein